MVIPELVEPELLSAATPEELERYRRALRALVPKDAFAALGYLPSPKQALFHAATEDEVLYGGAKGGGKSYALVMEALRACVEYPGIRVGAFRRTYDELAESLLKVLDEVDYARALGANWNGTLRDLTFPSGSVIRFRYAESVIDASRRQGGEYQLLVIDELTLMLPEAVEALKEGLRSGRSDVPVLGLRAGSNPGGFGHAAVKARFITATGYGERTFRDEQGFTVRFIPARVDDNSHVDAAYRRRLEAIPDPARRAAMLLGSWDVFEGAVFGEYDRDRHVVRPFPLPTAWPRYAGIDWGYTAPWAVVWGAVDEDGRLWVYRELYERRVDESEQARRILDAERDEPTAWRLADPSMWSTRGEAEKIADTYARSGCLIHEAKNPRHAGWSRLHECLSDGPACRLHREQGWETCPRVHFFPSCVNLLRTLPSLPYSKRRPEDVDTNAEDHAADALRYLVMGIGGAPRWEIGDEPPPEPEPGGEVAGLDEPTAVSDWSEALRPTWR